MVSKLTRTLIAALVLAGGAGRVAVSGPSDVEPAALAVAQTYFAALQAGDNQTLLGLFADRALASNEAQLSDPDYSRFLTERYRDARLEVINGGSRNGMSFVDIKIWMNDTESFRERLILKPSSDTPDASLHIVAQKELLD